jgi:hypothetical protein
MVFGGYWTQVCVIRCGQGAGCSTGIGQIFPVSQGVDVQSQDVTFARVGYPSQPAICYLICQIREVGDLSGNANYQELANF